MATTGRPRKEDGNKATVQVRISPDLAERLHVIALHRGCPVADVLGGMVADRVEIAFQTAVREMSARDTNRGA